MKQRSPRRQLVYMFLGVTLAMTFILPISRRWWVIGWSSAVSPMLSSTQQVHRGWSWPWEAGKLVQQRDDAVTQNQQLLTAVTTLQAQLETVQAAQELSRLVENIQRTSVISTVIGYSPDPGIQSITINRGTADGIVIGQAVLSPDGIVIGKVHEVSSTTSSIILLTDSHSTILARINNTEHSPGVVRGQQGVGLQMELLPRNDVIRPGDTVVTSGAEDRIPMNLPIGTVGEVATRQGDVFQNATVRTVITAFRLIAVAVILR